MINLIVIIDLTNTRVGLGIIYQHPGHNTILKSLVFLTQYCLDYSEKAIVLKARRCM